MAQLIREEGGGAARYAGRTDAPRIAHAGRHAGCRLRTEELAGHTETQRPYGLSGSLQRRPRAPVALAGGQGNGSSLHRSETPQAWVEHVPDAVAQ